MALNYDGILATRHKRAVLSRALALKEAQEAKRLDLEDKERFIANCCDLNVRYKDDGNPAFDLKTPGSPYILFDWHLENHNGHYKALFAGRRSGKTLFFSQALLWHQILNHELRYFFGGENTERASERSLWVRSRYEVLEDRYGPFRTDNWTQYGFTIQRPSGLGRGASVSVGGPDKPFTGGHPDDMWLDDVVGEIAYESRAEQIGTTKWFRDKLLFQTGPLTNVKVSGTIWPGQDHLYRWILDVLEENLHMEEIAPCVLYGEGKVFDVMSFTSGHRQRKAMFQCLPLEYLDKQFAINPMLARCQYDNEKLTSQDATFLPTDLDIMEPPEKQPLLLYMVTDCSGTKSPHMRKTSRTCFALVALDQRDHAYVLYARVGKFHPDAGPGIYLDMLAQCQAERKRQVEYGWFEMGGPGAMYPSLIRKEAAIRHVPEPTIMEVQRRTDTHQRILAFLLNPVRAHRLHFTRTVTPDMFRIASGVPTGEIGDEFMEYGFVEGGDMKKPDVLDAFCDVWGLAPHGVRLCPPPEPDHPHDSLGTAHTEAYFRMLRKIHEEQYPYTPSVD